jgi:polar amino acid transport system substrate-binding protein
MQIWLSLTLLFFIVMPARADIINLVTENYPPFNHKKDGKIIGTSVEQVNAMMSLAGLEYKLEMYPWKRAYQEALNDQLTCVFTTAQTEDRLPLFQWVLPLAINRSVLVSSKKRPIPLTNLDEAKKYRIGVQSGFADISILAHKGFNVEKFTTYVHLKKLLKLLDAARLDLVAMAESRYTELLAEGYLLTQESVIEEMNMGLACNKKMPTEFVDKMQNALAKVRKKSN